MKKIKIFLLLFFTLCINAVSQLQINSTYTPQQLVQNFFIGGGVTVTNVQFQGNIGGTGCSQIGYFSNGNTTSLGMSSGIVLATGCVENIAQVGSSFMSNIVGSAGLTEITNIAGNTSYDGARLEFDFIPQDSPIMFTYVFASEEYPEWVGSSYNDAFGFFISGPNPNGGNYNNVNIALIPNTSTPVSINNVNGGSYSQYYVNNDGSNNHPVFDGFTTPLVAQINVVPCQQYHIRISIADVGDQIYDSGVFLLRNSLATDAIDLTITYSSGSAPAVEGCSYATITASTAIAPSTPATISWSFGGNATNGLDCNNIPNSITIPAGQTSNSIQVIPTLDGINEGLEYLVLIRTDACGNTKRDTIYFMDNTPLSVNAGQDQTLCQSALPATLTATPIGGAPPYNYQWNNNAGNTQTVQVSPTNTTHYMVTVTDACNQTATDVVDVIIIPNPTSTFVANTPICAGEIVTVNYTGNASQNATYNWNFSGATVLYGGNGQGPHQITWYTPGTYNISLTVNEGGCNSLPTQQTITVYDPSSPQCCSMPNPNAGPDKSVCGLTTNLEAIPSMTGNWTSIPNTAIITQINNPNSSVSVPTPGTYQFIWTETTSPSCINSDTVTITFIQQPIGNAGVSTQVCSHTYQMQAYSNIGIGTWSVTPNNGVSIFGINNPNTNVTVQNDGVYTFTWTVNNNGCISTSQVQIGFYQMPNSNAGTDDAVCQLNYTLQALSSVGIGIWSYSGPGTVQFSNINSPNSAVNANVSGTYTFIWTENNNGCIDKDTVIIQLTKTPTSEFMATSINCYGNTSLVTYTGNAEPGSIFQWNWDGGNAIPGSGSGPHEVSWSVVGNHTISLTVSYNGCTSQITNLTLNNPSPISTNIIKNDLLCKNDQSGSINLTVTDGTPPYTYQWSNGYTYEDLNNLSGGIYSVTVTDSNGCTKIDGTTIYEPSQIVISVTPSQYICQHIPAYLNISANGGTPPYQFLWNNQLSNPNIMVTPSTQTTYIAQVIDANGCQSQIATTTVYVAPDIHVNLIANTTNVCPGDPVMITPVIWGGVGPPYAIYNHLGDLVTPPIYIYPSESGWYSIRVEDACISWDTSSIYINVYPLPPINILADTLEGCQPLKVQFNEVNPDSGYSYMWNFGDNSNLSLIKNPTHTYNISGIFDVSITVISQHGCKNQVTYNDMIKVWPKPFARFTWTPEIATEIKPEINFINLSNGAFTYQWMFGDGDSSSHINPTHKYPKADNYQVELIAVSNKGCKDTAYAIVKILEHYTFYAPTAFSPDGDRINDFFYVIAHGIKEESFKLEIYDRWGEIIWQTNKFNKDKEISEMWDGRAKNNEIVPIGTYTWRCVFRDVFDRTQIETGVVNVIR